MTISRQNQSIPLPPDAQEETCTELDSFFTEAQGRMVHAVSQRMQTLFVLPNWRWEERLPQLLPATLWSLVMLAPLVWGGRHDAGRLVFALLAMGAAVAWLVLAWRGQQARWVVTPALWIPVAATAWMALQMVPLPAWLVTWLAPRNAELFTLWSTDQVGGLLGSRSWQRLSLNPTATSQSLAVFLGHALVFFLTLQYLRTQERILQVLGWIAMAGGFMAIFGLLQYYTAEGLFFWVYEHPFRSTEHFVCGSFVNRNHCASFLAMGGMAIACMLLLQSKGQTLKALLRRKSSQRRLPATPVGASEDSARRLAMIWAGLLVLVLFAIFMTCSRGGALAAGAGMVVLGAVYWRGGVLGTRQVGYLLVAAVLLGGLLSLQANEQMADRLDDLTSGSIEELDRAGSRRAIWSANLEAIRHGLLTGAGAGTHRDIYPVYLEKSYPTNFSHAENGYLQIATELGLPGVALLVAVFGFVIHWAKTALRHARTYETYVCLGAILAGLTMSAVHSVVDFVWYIPATMTVVVMLLAMLCRMAQLAPEEKTSRQTRTQPFTFRRRVEASLLALLVGIYVFRVLIPPAMASGAWDRYLTISAMQELQDQHAYEKLIESGQATALLAAPQRLQQRAKALQQTVSADPNSAAAHLRLAQTYLRLFDARAPLRENQIGLSHLQATVAGGGFRSADELQQWLARAVGDDCGLLDQVAEHARQAIQLAPATGLAYVALAQVAFREDPTGESSEQLLQQALRVQPYEGQVLFELGKHDLLAGDLATAIDYWQRSYQQAGSHRLLVINALAGRIPAAAFIETFQPDWDTLHHVWQRYVAAGQPADLDAVLAHAEAETEKYMATPGQPAAVYVWQWLARMYRDHGDSTQQVACLERALQENPHLYSVRQDYAIALYHVGRYAEAQSHLRWCLARRPDLQSLRRLLHEATKARIAQLAQRCEVPSSSPRVQ